MCASASVRTLYLIKVKIKLKCEPQPCQHRFMGGFTFNSGDGGNG